MRYAIYPERQGTISASSENGAYPATNLTDNYSKHVWKAVDLVQSSTLTIPISAVSASLGAIAIFNTNAASGSITITDTVTAATVLRATAWAIDHGRYFQTFTPTVNALSASLTLTTTESTLEAGIVRAGDVVEIANPQYGVSEGRKSYSIKKELRNGAYYGKKLNIVRTFSYSLILPRESTYYDLMTLYEYYDPFPFAMFLADSITDTQRWAIFGCFTDSPGANHGYSIDSDISVSIEETI